MEILRSLLFVPADSPRKIAKAQTLRPDACIFDLEDAVAPNNKSAARKELTTTLEGGNLSPAPTFVRVNSAKTSFFADDLLAAVHPRVNGLVLPKSDDPAAVAAIDSEIARLEHEKGIPPGKTKLLLIIETALGVVRADDLAQCSSRVAGIVFGAEDYCADVGVSRSRTGDEIAFPRAAVALHARAHRLHAIDGVFTDISDELGFFEEARRAKRLGYTGKALIHPGQIGVAHRAFAPEEQEVVWARQVIAAYEAARSAGIGVALLNQAMIDEPILNQAKRVLRQHELSL